MKKISAIFTDIDGVIVGETPNVNSPMPHTEVINALTTISNKNIPIVLITAKAGFAIEKLVNTAKLHNPHISDGGAIVLDPTSKTIVKSHVIEKDLASNLIKQIYEAGLYLELYTANNYFIDKNQKSEITTKHSFVLERDPEFVENPIEKASSEELIKIMPVTKTPEEKAKVIQIMEPFKDKLTLFWGMHPVMAPWLIAIIVAKGISKESGAEEARQALGLEYENILGIGDSASDWQFMQHCGYVATLDNGVQEIKDLVKSKGQEHSFISPSVEQNGALEIFRHFELL